MGGPLSVTFNDIYIFYRRFVDEIYSRRKLGDNVLFDRLNSYHPNIKLTIEVNPSKFLDTKLTNIDGTYKFNVYRKNTKLPSLWTSKTPKRYERNTVNGDLHRSKRISSNFDEEIPLIKEKFMKADYPLRFINSVVNEFRKGKECGDERFIIPTSLFEIAKPLIFVEIPYCELNEIKSKHFLKKFHKFTSNSFRMVITWKTIMNRVLSKKEIVLVGHVTLVKPNVMRKLDGMNIILQLKVQNHRTPSKQHQPLFYTGRHFKCSKKC